jgi:hypothetical protein
MVVAQVPLPTLVLTLLLILRLIPKLLLMRMVAAQERPSLPIKARTKLDVPLLLLLLAFSVCLL